MGNVFSNLNGLESLFLICAAVGGVFVLLRLILQFSGGDTDTHADIHVDTGMEGHLDAHHVDSDVSFKLLSIHGLFAFLFMFGLVGFAFYRQSQAGAFVSLPGGVLAGLAAVWIIGRVFKFIGRLQSSGTVDNVSAIGAIGSVYLTIPPNGTGKVMVSAKNRLREFDASSHNREEIKTGEQIKVVWVEGNTLIVERLANKKGEQNA